MSCRATPIFWFSDLRRSIAHLFHLVFVFYELGVQFGDFLVDRVDTAVDLGRDMRYRDSFDRTSRLDLRNGICKARRRLLGLRSTEETIHSREKVTR